MSELILPEEEEILFTLEDFRALPEEERARALSNMTDEEVTNLFYDYEFRARPKQRFPKGDWFLWLLLSGRGFGKSFVGSNWIIRQAMNEVGPSLAILAPTAADLRDICIEGPSGILASCHPKFKPKYSKSIGQLVFPNGVKVLGFSAEDPEQIRGFNGAGIWMDEFAVYRYPRETFELAQMANRLGKNPQFVITTTPKPIKQIREWVGMAAKRPDKYVITTGSTYENKANLASSFIEQIAMYEGTSIGRQEIYGEVLDLESAAIIQRSWFNLWPHDKPLPNFEYIIQSYDTAFTEKTSNDKTACITFGIFREKGMYRVMILDAWDDRLNYPDLRTRVEKEFASLFGIDQQKDVDAVVIESKGSGLSLYQDMDRIGIPAFAYNPGREDKVMRLNSIAHLVEKGFVYLLESEKTPGKPKSWYRVFLDELCSFSKPGPEVDDDYCDAFSQALRFLRDQGFVTVDDFREVDEEEKILRANPYAI